MRKVKVAVLAIVLLVAVGLTVRSSLLSGAPSGGAPTQQFAAAPRTDGTDAAPTSSAGSEQPHEAPPVVCGTALNSLSALNEVAADKDAVFILLPGKSQDAAKQASGQVEEALKKISATGARVAAFTLQDEAPERARLIEALSIETLPSIVVIGRGSGAAAVSGEITEGRLLGAYVQASTPSSCGVTPGASSGCCP